MHVTTKQLDEALKQVNKLFAEAFKRLDALEKAEAKKATPPAEKKAPAQKAAA